MADLLHLEGRHGITERVKGVSRVTIVGGGTAGWMVAAALGRLIAPLGVGIRLIESEAIGTVGVGEATLPHLRFFNERLGIDEAEFMRATGATIKLGIEFADWGQVGDRYIHPFGDYGRPGGGVGFQHHWIRARTEGRAGRICEYSLPIMMAEQGRFAPPTADPDDVSSTYSYAYQMDAGLYAAFLRRLAERSGVQRIEGRIIDVARSETGDVATVLLEDGQRVGGDLFIDCSGFRGLLIEEALKAGYDDWSDVLPCDRAVAAPSPLTGHPPPYTRAQARAAGWQWRIPLQHRAGNGYVYCSSEISDDEAAGTLLASVGEDAGTCRFLRFKTGVRRRQWSRNVVAIGLSAGFLEPLESTSIYLIQAGITTLVELFPLDGIDASDVAEFERVMALEYERVRDFLVLHYHATGRDDTPFWQHMRTMAIPDSLAYKMELFKATGEVVQYKDGLFLEPSWLAVYLGQDIVPSRFDDAASRLPSDRHDAFLGDLRRGVRQAASAAPPHVDYLSGPRSAAA